jgi:hypothetical protein
MIGILPQRSNIEGADIGNPIKGKPLKIETRTPDLEEVETILRQAREARAVMISDFFRRLFHRPAHPPVGTAHTA